MTREEIIDGLKFTVEMFLFDPTTGETFAEPRNDMDKITIDACRGAIKALEQEPKTGHWIYKNGIRYCEFCGASNSTAYASYCPNCGAKNRKE